MEAEVNCEVKILNEIINFISEMIEKNWIEKIESTLTEISLKRKEETNKTWAENK